MGACRSGHGARVGLGRDIDVVILAFEEARHQGFGSLFYQILGA